MKKLEKMSLANIEGKLSRKEMKTIMAGSGSASTTCYTDSKVCYSSGGTDYTCYTDSSLEGEKGCCCGHDSGNDKCIMG